MKIDKQEITHHWEGEIKGLKRVNPDKKPIERMLVHYALHILIKE